MKKAIYSLIFIFLFSSGVLFAVEGEVRVAEKPAEYREPTSAVEAKEAWQKAEQESSLAEKERQESAEEWKTALGEMNKAQPGTPEFQTADSKYNQGLKRWSDAGKTLEAWQARKEELNANQLVQQYQQELQVAYTPPIEPTFEEPGFWAGITKRVNSWFKERQADFYTWTGNKAKVIEVRQDLAQIYADLGKGGALDKARNTKELSAAFDELSGKIGKGLESLTEYQEALDKGALTEKQKVVLQTEIKELAQDLFILRDQLATDGVDRQIRDTMNAEIDKALEAFGIEKEARGQLEQQASQAAAPLSEQEITALAGEVYGQLRVENPEWAQAVARDVKYADNAAFKSFVKNLNKLARVDLAQLAPVKRAEYSLFLRDGYKKLNDALWQQASDLSIPPGDRVITLVRLAELSPKLREAEENLDEAQDAFYKEIGIREPTPEELEDEEGQMQAPLKEGSVKRYEASMQKTLDTLLQGIGNRSVQKEYADFFAVMKAWEDNIAKSAVSQESIDVREKMLETYGAVLEKIGELVTDQDLSTPEMSKMYFDLFVKINNLSGGLEFDREMLVVIKEEMDKVQAEPVQAHARLQEETVDKQRTEIEDELKAQREQLRQNWERLSPEERRQLFLLELKMGRELNATTVEKATSGDEFVEALAGQLQQEQQEQQELAPELEAKLRAAKTDTQVKIVVAEASYEAARQALSPTKTRAAQAPRDWWDKYVAEGVEPGGQVGVPAVP